MPLVIRGGVSLQTLRDLHRRCYPAVVNFPGNGGALTGESSGLDRDSILPRN